MLIENNNKQHIAESLLLNNQQLLKHIPVQYSSTGLIIQFMIEKTKDHQWQLEHFVMKFYGKIAAELNINSSDKEDELFVLPE